jgi:hypothetical protein
MERQTTYLVFQCYGHEGIFHECAFALLSLARLYNGTCPVGSEVWIFTDNPDWFKAQFRVPGMPLHFAVINNDVLKRWRGSIDFVHRVKIEVLKEFTKERHGNIIYADTDVVFNKPLQPIINAVADGQLFMHVMEGVVSTKMNPIFTKLDAHLRDSIPMQVNGKPLWDLAMWNAGVLCFNSRYRHLLDDVLTFTDTEYPKFPKHVVEQFAFSVFFRQMGEIKAAAPYILHYWNLKEVRTLLASFFSYFRLSPWEDVVKASELVQMHVLMQEKVNFLANRDITDKLLKKNWQPQEYNWRDMQTALL